MKKHTLTRIFTFIIGVIIFHLINYKLIVPYTIKNLKVSFDYGIYFYYIAYGVAVYSLVCNLIMDSLDKKFYKGILNYIRTFIYVTLFLILYRKIIPWYLKIKLPIDYIFAEDVILIMLISMILPVILYERLKKIGRSS